MYSVSMIIVATNFLEEEVKLGDVLMVTFA